MFCTWKFCDTIPQQKALIRISSSVPDFLMKLEQKGFPAFETVRRSRQKVQATYPNLAATGAVGEFRARNEKVYREFAKSEA